MRRPREIVQALDKLQEKFDLPSNLCNEVRSLAKWLQSFEFVLLATFWFKTLQTVDNISRCLQSSKITLDEESRLMKSLLSELQESKIVASGMDLYTRVKVEEKTKHQDFHGENRSTVYEHEEVAIKVSVLM